jgi:hypothetical protein
MNQSNENAPIIVFLGWFAILSVVGAVVITIMGMKADLIVNLAATTVGALGGAYAGINSKTGDK